MWRNCASRSGCCGALAASSRWPAGCSRARAAAAPPSVARPRGRARAARRRACARSWPSSAAAARDRRDSSGSTRRSRSATSVGSVSASGLRPPPGRRTRPGVERLARLKLAQPRADRLLRRSPSPAPPPRSRPARASAPPPPPTAAADARRARPPAPDSARRSRPHRSHTNVTPCEPRTLPTYFCGYSALRLRGAVRLGGEAPRARGSDSGKRRVRVLGRSRPGPAQRSPLTCVRFVGRRVAGGPAKLT